MIPVVDFSSSPERVAKELLDACQQTGFVRIINHPLSESALDEAFESAKRLFALPDDDKMKAPHPKGWTILRGYSWPGLEKVSQAMTTGDNEEARKQLREVPDVKEVYDIGSENNTSQPNQWLPDETLPGFKDFITQFYWDRDQVGKEVLRALAIGLNLEADYLTRKHSGYDNQLRLSTSSHRCAAHTDWSSITLLFQDDCGGLEVEDISRPGTFVPAPPVKYSIIMNVGDLLQRWSNDRLRSTNHRVSLPELSDRIEGPNRVTRERYSIPYFMSPDDDTIIECIPSCMSEEQPAKYEPITRANYNKMRASMMY
ncbi:hypothetical protein BDV12DRAFT_190233 [Aspergillus spectabilis]